LRRCSRARCTSFLHWLKGFAAVIAAVAFVVAGAAFVIIVVILIVASLLVLLSSLSDRGTSQGTEKNPSEGHSPLSTDGQLRTQKQYDQASITHVLVNADGTERIAGERWGQRWKERGLCRWQNELMGEVEHDT